MKLSSASSGCVHERFGQGANADEMGRVFSDASPERMRRSGVFAPMVAPHQIKTSGRQIVALQILDRFSIGIILLDSAGRILFANAAARCLLRNGHRLGARASIFDHLPPATSRRLGDRLEQPAGAPTTAISVPHTSDGSSLMLVVSSVRPKEAAQLGRGLQQATTILFLCDPARAIDLPAVWMMDAYGLTVAEARAALSASSGTTVAAIARQLGLSPNTIKTHLRRVFAKTDTGRQAELTRLVTLFSVVRDPAVTGAD